MSVPISRITVTIAEGAALSGAFTVGDKTPCALQMPAAWTAADITFQVSDDGGTTWQELRDDAGTAVSIAGPTAGYRYQVISSPFASGCLFKLRSGTSALAVNQVAARTLYIIARPFYFIVK